MKRMGECGVKVSMGGVRKWVKMIMQLHSFKSIRSTRRHTTVMLVNDFQDYLQMNIQKHSEIFSFVSEKLHTIYTDKVCTIVFNILKK